MTLTGWCLVAFAVVVAIVIVAVIVVVRSVDRWDWEQLRGLGVLATAVGVLAACAILAIPNLDMNPLWRAGIAVAATAIALFAASKNWRPGSLWVTAGIAGLIIAFIVLDIGRQATVDQVSVDSINELELTATAVTGLEKEAVRLAAQAGADAGDPTASGVSDVVNSGEAWRAIATACEIIKKAPADAAEQAAPADSTTAAGSSRHQCEFDIPGDQPSADDEQAFDTLPVAMALMRLELAEYRASVLGRPEDDKAVAAAEQAVAAAQAAIPTATAEPVSLLDTFSAGGNAIATEAFGDDPPVALETAGWVVIAIIVLLFWRMILLRSYDQLPGPVTITPNTTKSPRDGDPSTIDIQKATLRASVLRNLSEPGAIPGSSAIEPVTDLLEIPGIGDTWYAAIISALKSIVRTPRGSEITFDVVPSADQDRPWTVLVRVSGAGGGREIDVGTQTGPNGIEACRAAGFWAAAVVLARSSRIASWARWDKDTSQALARFDDPARQATADLECAVAQAPSSGVLLQKLAFNYAIDGRAMDAISASARAVAAHPRYSIARYRLAVGLNMLTVHIETWTETSLADRRRIANQIRRAAKAMALKKSVLKRLDSLIENPRTSNPASVFADVADAMFVRIKRTVTWPVIATRALRRSERDVWWPPGIKKFGRDSVLHYARWTAKSLRLIDHPSERDQRKVEKRAAKSWSWYQLSYNLACMATREGDWDTALTWLETSLERPGSWQMTDCWIDADSDLVPIRQTARYRWLHRQLHPEKGEE